MCDFAPLKLHVKTQEPCVENIFPKKFWVYFIDKKVSLKKRRSKVVIGKSLGEAIK